ncbi:MAG: Sec-independent protein translocase protein TatA [Legionellaceae bacterium]
MISPSTLVLTTIIAALVFGTKRLRSFGEDLGMALRGFRQALNADEKKQSTEAVNEK